MTVTTPTAKVTGLGNGSAFVFSYDPIVIFAASEMVVTHVVISTGVETLLTEGTGAANYSVSPTTFPAAGAIGSVTYPADSVTEMPTGEKIVMKRTLVLNQLTDLQNQGTYFPNTLETQMDRLAMYDIQQQELIDRSFKLPIGDASGTTPEIASLSGNAGRFLRANAAEDQVEFAAVTSTDASASNVGPLALGTVAAGTAADLAREDHVHPTTGLGVLALANTFTANQTITPDGAAGQFFLGRSDTHGAGGAVGRFVFRGKDSAGAIVDYAVIEGAPNIVTPGGEQGWFVFKRIQSGSLSTVWSLSGGLWSASVTGGEKSAGTINCADYYRAGVKLTVATQAIMEAAADNTFLGLVTAGNMKDHPGATKLWASVDRSAGTPSLNSPSYNITSVADGAAGVTTVTIATDFSSAVYSPGACALVTGSALFIANVGITAAGTFDVFVFNTSGSAEDTTDFTCWAFGDQ